MPKVGDKTFTYDSKGFKDAEKYAKDTGQTLQVVARGGKVKMMKGGMKPNKKKGYMHGGMKKPKNKR